MEERVLTHMEEVCELLEPNPVPEEKVPSVEEALGAKLPDSCKHSTS